MSNSVFSNTYTIKLDFKPGPHLESFKEYKTSKGFNCRVEMIAHGSWDESKYGRYYASVIMLDGSNRGLRYYYWVEGPSAGKALYLDALAEVGNILLQTNLPRKQTQLHLF